MSTSQPMIEAAGLTKFFGSFLAIENVSFKVGAGEVVAFLGPNGAGKSTTMRILAGYLAPSAGTARIAGLDVFQHRLATSRKIGFLPENGPLYPEMTPRELLGFFAEARAMQPAQARERLDVVIEQCALQGVLDKPIRKLSRGYRQRVGMAHVLLHEPEVLIMDEPTSGLDPNQILHVRDTIRRIGETKTILLSTHILQEVEAVASRVILISRDKRSGRIVFDGTPGELRQKGGGNLDTAFHTLTGAA